MGRRNTILLGFAMMAAGMFALDRGRRSLWAAPNCGIDDRCIYRLTIIFLTNFDKSFIDIR